MMLLDLSLHHLQHLSYQQTEKGVPTISGKPKSESKDKEKKHKKHKDKDRDKDKEHKKHKHRHKDRSKDKDKDRDKDKKKDKSGHHDSGGDHSKKHHDKVGSFSEFSKFNSSKSLSILSNYIPYVLMASNVHELYQKRKHEGTEDSADVHKHKKSKVVHSHCFLAGKHILFFFC